MKNTRKSNILTVMKKELRRFFGDRRMVMTIILPGLLIYLIYTLMGDALMSNITADGGDTTTVYKVQAVHMSDTVHGLLEASGAKVQIYQCPDCDEPHDAEAMADSIRSGSIDLFVVFPENFDALVATYDPASGQPAPEVQIYYDSTASNSTAAYALMTGVLDVFESSMANRFDVNRSADVTYDLASEEDITGMLFSMLMPLLLIMLTFSGCMAVAPESIAGEKERGTIATLLVTPLRRSELAIGKIAAISIIALLSGTCSFLGVILSLPKLVGGEEMGMVDASIYGVTDYLWILGVILSTVLLFVSVISVLSALAKSVKEAASMVTPLMLLVTVIGVSGMFSGGTVSPMLHLIPVYNSVQCISGIFSMSYEPVSVIITMAVNVAVSAVMVAVLTKVFNSERVMFNK